MNDAYTPKLAPRLSEYKTYGIWNTKSFNLI